MILVTGTFRIPPGSLAKVLPEMEHMIAASRAEDGCLDYSYALDVLDQGLVHVVERWRDQASLDAHLTTAHLTQWRAQFPQLGITDRALSAVNASGATPF